MLSQKQVIQLLRKEKPYLQETYNIIRIGLFGSFAQDKANDSCDIDLFMEFDKPIGLKFIQLNEYLEQRLGKMVDIITPAGINSIRLNKVKENIINTLISPFFNEKNNTFVHCHSFIKFCLCC